VTPTSQQEIQCIIVMGVAGSGKTAVAQAMAMRWDDVFIEADDLHSASNIRKLSSGIPLDDHDRLPWLRAVGERIRSELSQNRRTVTSCSALKRAYRDVLREYAPAAYFVELDAPIDVARARVTNRNNSFMSPSLLDSQFATLEPLASDERGVRVDATFTIEGIVDIVELALVAPSPT
jgi:gluconokinase